MQRLYPTKERGQSGGGLGTGPGRASLAVLIPVDSSRSPRRGTGVRGCASPEPPASGGNSSLLTPSRSPGGGAGAGGVPPPNPPQAPATVPASPLPEPPASGGPQSRSLGLTTAARALHCPVQCPSAPRPQLREKIRLSCGGSKSRPVVSVNRRLQGWGAGGAGGLGGGNAHPAPRPPAALGGTATQRP